jgi:predicted O-methyltransferase YrrM
MSSRTLQLTDGIYQYLLDHSLREDGIARELREHTAGQQWAAMQISPEQGQFMTLLVELLGARRILEVGTFTGYSALCLARALPADGELVCCDISEEWTAVGIPYWERAGVRSRIKLCIQPALLTLDALLADGRAGGFDMAFIDADKVNYQHYYERGLQLLRPGGLLLIDNTLWGGSVADPADQDADTLAIRALNDKLLADERVTLSLLPIGDGLTLARKR